jgi:hypothetical protein
MRDARTLPFIDNRVLSLGVIFLLAFSASACNYPTRETSAPSLSQVDAARRPSAVLRDTITPTVVSTPSPTLSGTSASVQSRDEWQVYHNQQYAFEIKYPQGGVLVDERPDGSHINLPFEPGTNLREEYLQIDIQEGPTQCQSPIASGYSPDALEQAQVEVGGNSFQRESGSEGAAGNFYDWIAYSTTRGDICLSLTFVLHSLDPYNFETPLAEFDLQSESQSFNKIVATFEWLR